MSRRFLSLSRKERAALLDAKQDRFLKRLARELEALGPNPKARACETCGENFEPPRSNARFCSNACRQRAYRVRASSSIP